MKSIHPITIWFTGLSASGKSTLSEILYNKLKDVNVDVELLDGESVRDMLKNYQFDQDSREQLGLQKAKIALELNRQGKVVLVSGIAHKKKWRSDIRKIIGNYFEVFLNCDVKDCASRDYKGNYSKALSGQLKNFVGVDEMYEESDECELVLHTGRDSINICADILFERVKKTIGV